MQFPLDSFITRHFSRVVHGLAVLQMSSNFCDSEHFAFCPEIPEVMLRWQPLDSYGLQCRAGSTGTPGRAA